jgi:cyclopropane fatty-acyl-phospholipid synthase-like methyltransferase
MRARSLSAFASGSLKAILACLILIWAGPFQQPMWVGAPAHLRSAAEAQPAHQRDTERIRRPTSPPYTGDLAIFEDPTRDQKLQVGRVMDILGIREGSSVADIGAGSGWFTVRAARRIGNGGMVLAVDINSDYIRHIEERIARENLPNVRTILGKEDDPRLPPRSVDAVLLLKTYHEVAQPIRLLAYVREAMRPGARLGIIDRNGKGDDHGIDTKTVIKEAMRAGFSLIEQYDFVKSDQVDYFLVFRVRSEG